MKESLEKHPKSTPMIIAGPCAFEDANQVEEICREVQRAGATVFRAGIWKGQNRPVVKEKPCYWGIGDAGMPVLVHLQEKYKIPCVTEIQSEDQLKLAIDFKLQMLQIGARHMQNFPLIRRIASEWRNPIILKRGLGSTIEEWTGIAEHLATCGNQKIILCERGIVSFERSQETRWRLDVLAIPQVKTDYPKYQVIADVSHGTGRRELAIQMARAAIAAGADGIMVEVHTDPEKSKTDARQTLGLALFERLVREVNRTWDSLYSY
jgi:3-deoxy-7-phosphoheptulonate synthase